MVKGKGIGEAKTKMEEWSKVLNFCPSYWVMTHIYPQDYHDIYLVTSPALKSKLFPDLGIWCLSDARS